MFRLLIISLSIGISLLKPDCNQRYYTQSGGIKDKEINDQIDTTILHVDTTNILGYHYMALYKNNDVFYLLRDNDTILKDHLPYNDFKFIKFDSDKYKDLVVSYLTNIGGVEDVYIYDPTDHSFKLIDDLKKYPSSEHLVLDYYYSYHRAGCADQYWVSDLFQIKDFKTILVGKIYGEGCEPSENKIEIFKITNNDERNKSLVLTLPLDTINKFSNNKWGFIKDFWTKKYPDFIN
jgi:hypothetical protein